MSNERGAMLIHTAVAFVGILGFGSLVIDQGVMYMSRRQAQNAADAAALAGAISIGFIAPGDFEQARASARILGRENRVFGLSPDIAQGFGDGCDQADDISFPFDGDGCGHSFTHDQCPVSGSCIRVNVYRNEEKDPLPMFLGGLFGMEEQGVKATATAETASGNQVDCLIPFAIMDRWADNFDSPVDATYFPNDGLTGVAGWTPNDGFESEQGDTYTAPYDGNAGLTGWTVDVDYGRQFILKDGSTNPYSSGWFNEVDLPDSTGSQDYQWNIEHCNQRKVGIAKVDEPCTAQNEPLGCMSIKTGGSTGPTRHGIETVVSYDSAAHWDWSKTGPDGKAGAVDGGKGMVTPRIRPLAVLDINHYMAQGCSGTTCIGKVANIIGFFVEGVCKDVALDTGMACDDPNKDIVGRIVTLPGQYASGGGSVETPAQFVRVIRLIR